MAARDRITYTDKLGDLYEISLASRTDKWALADMYDRFAPKAITQGLPPADDATRLEWIKRLLTVGINYIVWQKGLVVGHCSLILDLEHKDGEYLIFVNGPFRNRGLGTELTRLAVAKAMDSGLRSIWLTVEALNFRAIKLYKKIGFVFCDSGERERTMVLQL
jgi:ribosomal protein S18 acetylase RimI-like enzyme